MNQVYKAKDDHHLVRLVKRSHQETDGDGNVVGVMPAAFDLRPNEDYLSCNCIERAEGTSAEASLLSIRSVYGSKFRNIAKHLLTKGRVQSIKRAFLPHAVKVTCEPKKQDPSYSAVRQYPSDRQLALEKLATEAWADWIRVNELPK